MRALLRIALLKYIHQQLEEKGDLQAIVLLKYSLYSMSVNIHGLHNDFAPSITSRGNRFYGRENWTASASAFWVWIVKILWLYLVLEKSSLRCCFRTVILLRWRFGLRPTLSPMQCPGASSYSCFWWRQKCIKNQSQHSLLHWCEW
jgi:hypothetical protein